MSVASNYTEAATKIASMFRTNFNNEVSILLDKIDNNVILIDNANNINDLYIKYGKENSDLMKEYTTEYSDIETNDRKTYYENQEIDILKNIYKVLITIYIIIVIVYCVLIFTHHSPYNWKIKLPILIFFIILPFISTKILSFIISIIYKIYNLFPKNIYNNL